METTTFGSRIQVSLDGGNSFFYDTATDSTLTSGFRFDGSGRYFIWDVAGQAAPTYDNFSVNTAVVPEPSTIALAGIGGLMMLWIRSRKSKRS